MNKMNIEKFLEGLEVYKTYKGRQPIHSSHKINLDHEQDVFVIRTYKTMYDDGYEGSEDKFSWLLTKDAFLPVLEEIAANNAVSLDARTLEIYELDEYDHTSNIIDSYTMKATLGRISGELKIEEGKLDITGLKFQAEEEGEAVRDGKTLEYDQREPLIGKRLDELKT